MLTALDHVILAVRDLDAASAAYQTLLGLTPSWTGTHPESGTANVLFRVENTYLELLSPMGDGDVSGLLGAWLDARGDGLLGLAFATTDIDACRATLAARGLEPGLVEAGRGRDLSSGAERHWRRAMLPPHLTRGVLIFPIEHDSGTDVLPMAASTADCGAVVYALDHAVVQTTDGDSAKALFGEGLGLRLALDKKFPDWGVRLMFFRVGGVTVEVAAALDGADIHTTLPGDPTTLPGARATLAGRHATDGQDRLYGMSWRVPSVDAARERLVRAGVDVSEVRAGRRPGTRVFTVRSGTCGVPTLMLELDIGAR